MGELSTGHNPVAKQASIDRENYKLWHERPVGKFCMGFAVFVTAEFLVYGTLHWIFPLIQGCPEPLRTGGMKHRRFAGGSCPHLFGALSP